MQPLTGAEGGGQRVSASEPLDQVQLLSQPAGCEVVLAHAALDLQAQPGGLTNSRSFPVETSLKRMIRLNVHLAAMRDR